MDLLKEFVDEEELLKVSGGEKTDRKNFFKMITSLALVGTLCVPDQGVTGVQQKEKQNDKKSSHSVGLPPKEKVAIGVTGIVGVGVILEEVLRRKVFAKKDKNCGEITAQEYTEMREHFMKIATRPQDCKTEDFKKYTVNKLKGYILAELITWFSSMAIYYGAETNSHGKNPSYQSIPEREQFTQDWHSYLPDLIAADHATTALLYVSGTVNKESVNDYLTLIASSPLDLTLLGVEQQATYKWHNGLYPANKQGPMALGNKPLKSMLDPTEIDGGVAVILAGLLMDWSKAIRTEEDYKLDKEWAEIAADALTKQTDFAKTGWYATFIEMSVELM